MKPLLLISLALYMVTAEKGDVSSSEEKVINEWTIHIKGGIERARKLASDYGLNLLGEVVPDTDIYHLKSPRRSKRELYRVKDQISSHEDVIWADQVTSKVRVKRDVHTLSFPMNDPFWEKMWYLNRKDDLNMNVEGAWLEGVTGKGIAVTILDDGIEKDHPDLINNYDPLASTDINDNDSDPNPRYDFSNSNRHGTRCAGQVAASPNNSMCAVGIAYNARIGGIRMLDGQVSDPVEARSLSFNSDHIDIYSSSWGPNDDGKTVDGPGKLAQRAFLNGVTRGRNGKGSIFIWASGNGGRYKDNCNCDGYATSIFTITVSSTSESGQIPWYSEACASTMATTYSSGTTSERQIVTTDLHHSCTIKHTGTSASAPMAAAIVALALEANPLLTWRDVQHLIVRTSRPGNLRAPDWRMNAMGRLVSHSYGYGLMDTTAMVKLAKRWKTMPTQHHCFAESPYNYRIIPSMGFVTVQLEVKNCPEIKHLEHVVSPIHVSTGHKRGDVRIYIISPMGTRSTLLDARPNDYSTSGFANWPFMSVHQWGEDPSGIWTLEIHNDAYSKWANDAKFLKWSLVLYGTSTDPNGSQDVNVIRDVSENHLNPTVRQTSSNDEYLDVLSESSKVTTTTTTTTPVTTTKDAIPILPSGCVSKKLKCTRNIRDCRTFTHRSVANVFCRCTGLCLDVAVSLNKELEDIFNMQCDMSNIRTDGEVPFYCHMIPFFSH